MDRRLYNEGALDKRHYFKTAYVVGLNQCCVGLSQYREDWDSYLCLMPFGNRQWMHAKELKDFCL